MTLSGKVMVVNMLMALLYVHRMQIMPILKEQVISAIETAIEQFIWKGKHAKIPLKVLKLDRKDGGLGLVDIKTKHESLLCNWINDCEEFEQIRTLAEYHLGPSVQRNLIWEVNLTRKDSQICFPGNSFWHSLLHMWHEYNYHEPQNAQKICNELVCFNSHIRIQNKPIANKRMLTLRTLRCCFQWFVLHFHRAQEVYRPPNDLIPACRAGHGDTRVLEISVEESKHRR